MHHPQSLAQLVDAFDSVDRMLVCFVLLGTILFAAIFGIHRFRKRAKLNRRIVNGHCEFRGYDLRGAGRVCPECGKYNWGAEGRELNP